MSDITHDINFKFLDFFSNVVTSVFKPPCGGVRNILINYVNSICILKFVLHDTFHKY